MLQLKLLLVACATIVMPITSGARIHCIFETLNGAYGCSAETIDNVTSQNEEVTIEGLHLVGFGDIDVNFITFYQSVVNYIPTRMFNIFPSTSLFKLQDSALHTLTTDAFIGCSSMHAITISQNSFPNVAAGFAQSCITTKIIDFSFNEIQTVDKDAFTGLTKLTSIDLSNNRIAYVHPETFEKTPSMRTILLQTNQISTLHPATFSGMKKLSDIDLSYNKLIHFPKLNLSGSEGLTNLNLQWNLISSIDPEFTFPPSSAQPKWNLKLIDNTCVNQNFDKNNNFAPSKVPLCYILTTTTLTATTTTFASTTTDVITTTTDAATTTTDAITTTTTTFASTTTKDAATTTTDAAPTTTDAAPTTTDAATTTTDAITTTADAATTTTDAITTTFASTTTTDTATTTTDAASTTTDAAATTTDAAATTTDAATDAATTTFVPATTTTWAETTTKITKDYGICRSDALCHYLFDYRETYTCVLKNVAYVLSSIAGVHEDGYGDLDVVSLYFVSSQLVRIPRIIFDKFPNLDFLSASETGLTVLNDDIFEDCGILKELDVSNNQIRRINYSSLLKCKSLQWLNVTGNNLKMITNN